VDSARAQTLSNSSEVALTLKNIETLVAAGPDRSPHSPLFACMLVICKRRLCQEISIFVSLHTEFQLNVSPEQEHSSMTSVQQYLN
jgi:hypothetical protein